MGLRLPLWLWRKKATIRPGAVRTLKQFEYLADYRFRDPSLLDSALKHRSIIFQTGEARALANERLEFLGDAVLDLIVAKQLYDEYPTSREGHLTRLKSLVVSGRQLANKGRKMGLGGFMQLSAGEERSGGRNRRSILEDALEAVIGAIYLDGGMEPAERFIRKFITHDLDHRLIREKEKNYKSLLLEHVQGRGLGHPIYHVLSEDGPDHAKTFHVEVLVNDEAVGRGVGRSKKQAEQQAAKEATERFGLSGD
ncbi:MAG: ribonuclease III [bacterium]